MTDIQSFIKAFKFGNAQDEAAGTGCTVVVCHAGAIGGVDVRGGAPATRETDLLKPVNSVSEVHAIFLSGGSAYGLDVAGGIMKALEKRGIGFDVSCGVVPIVPGACLFDLGVGESSVRPDASFGEAAVEAAFAEAPFELGNKGAGTGASVGTMSSKDRAMKSGLGAGFAQAGEIKVGAIFAVNALGDVYDRTKNEIVAGLRTPDGSAFADSELTLRSFFNSVDENNALSTSSVKNTTIGCVFTNAKITKAQANKLASTAHDGLARAIRPVHTSFDGDTIFTLASGEVELPEAAVGTLLFSLAVSATEQAVLSAVMEAKGAYGLPAACDL